MFNQISVHIKAKLTHEINHHKALINKYGLVQVYISAFPNPELNRREKGVEEKASIQNEQI